jgi:hypothetical protein
MSQNRTSIAASSLLDKKSGVVKTIIDQKALATTDIDTIGDKVHFGPVPSNAVILDVLVLNDDLDSNGSPLLAADVGLSYTGIGGNQKVNNKTDGLVVDADCFGTAVTTLRAAVVSWTSLRCEADNIINVKKEAWEVAGLSEDCGGLLWLTLTVTAAAATAAAGDVVVRIDYI